MSTASWLKDESLADLRSAGRTTPVTQQAFFLGPPPGFDGQRFCLFHPAQGAVVRGAVLYVHPFAEEMNKSRRMAALQSRAFAAQGFAVLQLDLLGCGDSAGDFGDASWAAWVADVRHGVAWLAARIDAPLWLWGLRAGCLLATAAAADLNPVPNMLFWQPPSSGKLLLQQFLRLKLAADMLGGQTKGAMAALRSTLGEGGRVDVAGYSLTSALTDGLEQATLMPMFGPTFTPAGPAPVVHWLELAAHDEGAVVPPASAKTIAAWRAAGAQVRDSVLAGPQFWQTAEIAEAPALLSASCAAMLREGSP